MSEHLRRSRFNVQLEDDAREGEAYTITPQGGIALKACLSKAGIFPYAPNEAGVDALDMVYELRPVSEVCRPESADTLKNATITVFHPSEDCVDVDNFREVVVGHVGSDVHVEDDALYGTLYINDRPTVEAILAKRLVSLSPGYKSEIVRKSGIDERFGHYDQVQTNIQYNHVAILPPGANRQGDDVAIRIDSKTYAFRLDSNGDAVLKYDSQSEEYPEVNPDDIKNMIQGMLPDQEALLGDIADKVQQALPALIQQHLAAALRADMGEDDEPKTDEGDEPKLDEDDEMKADSDDEMKADSDDELKTDEDELKTDEDDELKTDEDDKPASRVDSLIRNRLEAVRLYERATGKQAPLSRKVTNRKLLCAAAKAKGVSFRKDASNAWLAGAVTFALQQKAASAKSAARATKTNAQVVARADAADAPEFVSMEEANRRRLALLAGKNVK